MKNDSEKRLLVLFGEIVAGATISSIHDKIDLLYKDKKRLEDIIVEIRKFDMSEENIKALLEEFLDNIDEL